MAMAMAMAMGSAVFHAYIHVLESLAHGVVRGSGRRTERLRDFERVEICRVVPATHYGIVTGMGMLSSAVGHDGDLV